MKRSTSTVKSKSGHVRSTGQASVSKKQPLVRSGNSQCWMDTFDGARFQGKMRRFRGPTDVALPRNGTGLGSLIIGPSAAVIAIGNCHGGQASEGMMLLQFRPRMVIDDFKKIRGSSDIEWLRILELPGGPI